MPSGLKAESFFLIAKELVLNRPYQKRWHNFNNKMDAGFWMRGRNPARLKVGDSHVEVQIWAGILRQGKFERGAEGETCGVAIEAPAMMVVMSEVTRLLDAIDKGDRHATAKLLPLVYDELRKLAAQKLTHEKPGQTLQATALVHEAYLRLVDGEQAAHWNSRGHFFGAAAEAMRRILVDQARQKRSLRRGGGYQRIELSSVEPAVAADQLDMLALDEALQQLAARDLRAAELVKLRFFAGLTVSEAANALAISVATAENDWAYAKSWLKLQLSTNDSEPR